MHRSGPRTYSTEASVIQGRHAEILVLSPCATRRSCGGRYKPNLSIRMRIRFSNEKRLITSKSPPERTATRYANVVLILRNQLAAG
jgi:hypothetical protein